MHTLTIQVPEPTYAAIAQAAVANGLTVEAMVAEQLEAEFTGGAEDTAIQRMFTPERLAKIDAAQASIRAGKGRTLEQLDERLAATKAEWLAANPA